MRSAAITMRNTAMRHAHARTLPEVDMAHETPPREPTSSATAMTSQDLRRDSPKHPRKQFKTKISTQDLLFVLPGHRSIQKPCTIRTDRWQHGRDSGSTTQVQFQPREQNAQPLLQANCKIRGCPGRDGVGQRVFERDCRQHERAHTARATGLRHSTANAAESFSPRWGFGFYYILSIYKAINRFSIYPPFQSTPRPHSCPQNSLGCFPISYPLFQVRYSQLYSL